MRLLLDFTKRLINQWEHVFGIVTFLFTVTTILGFIGINVLIPTWVSVILLISSLFFGSYFVFKEIINKIPSTAKLIFNIEEIILDSSGWGEVYPSSPLELKIKISINNQGDEKGRLSEINIASIDLMTKLFNHKIENSEIIQYPAGARMHKISLPIEVPGRDWISISCNIPIYTTNLPEPKLYAREIKDLSSFNVSLNYQYGDMYSISYS